MTDNQNPFADRALGSLTGKSSLSNSGGYRHGPIPQSQQPPGVRYCIALGAPVDVVQGYIRNISLQQGFEFGVDKQGRCYASKGFTVDYRYWFHLAQSPRGTDVFIMFNEPGIGWGPGKVLFLQKNIDALTSTLEGAAVQTGIEVTSPGTWLHPLYTGAGGYVAKAAGQTAKNAMFGCLVAVVLFVVGIVVLSLLMQGQRS